MTLLSQPLRILDILDVEAFVRATIARSPLRLTHDDPLETDLARDLGRALDAQWQIDRALTIKVGLLLAEDETPAGAATRLGIRQADVVACVKRIQRVAGALTNHREAA